MVRLGSRSGGSIADRAFLGDEVFDLLDRRREVGTGRGIILQRGERIDDRLIANLRGIGGSLEVRKGGGEFVNLSHDFIELCFDFRQIAGSPVFEDDPQIVWKVVDDVKRHAGLITDCIGTDGVLAGAVVVLSEITLSVVLPSKYALVVMHIVASVLSPSMDSPRGVVSNVSVAHSTIAGRQFAPR